MKIRLKHMIENNRTRNFMKNRSSYVRVSNPICKFKFLMFTMLQKWNFSL